MDILTEVFEEELESSGKGAIFDEVTARRCSTKDYDGVEYTFTGEWVPLEPILDVITKKDNYAVKNIGHAGAERELVVFVVKDDIFAEGTVLA